jgi:hypothetical protein
VARAARPTRNRPLHCAAARELASSDANSATVRFDSTNSCALTALAEDTYQVGTLARAFVVIDR